MSVFGLFRVFLDILRVRSHVIYSLKMYILACSITSIESKLVFDLPLNLKMGSNGLLGSLTYVYITQTDDQSKFLSCDVTFGQIRRSDQSKTVEWYNCPAGCTTLNQFEVIGKENGFYSIHSSICRSAIHKGIISGSFYMVFSDQPCRNCQKWSKSRGKRARKWIEV